MYLEKQTELNTLQIFKSRRVPDNLSLLNFYVDLFSVHFNGVLSEDLSAC